MKRKLTFFVAALMAMSCFSVTAYAANFSDINDAPWEGAKTYINSVADLGLMIGDIDPNNGKTRFRPKDKVTYCETTQLAYMALKNTNSLIPSTENLSTKWSQVLKSNNIPAWAYDCVAYALENNIISLYDVSRFMTKNGSKISDNYASRESVAVVFGKSLAHKYAVDESASLKYKDASSISSTSVPYVDLLSRLGILVGDTDNNFTPKTYINRAEMAVLVSKDYDILKNGNANVPSGGGTTNGGTNGGTNNGGTTATTEITGTVLTMEDYGGNKMLTVLTSTSQKLGFIVNETTYTIDGRTSANTQISALSLKAGDGVKVNYTGSQINVLTLTSSTTNTTTSTVKGTVDDITNDKIYLVKSSTTGSSDFYYYDTTYSITLDGDKASLKDLFDEFDAGGLDVELSLNSSQKVVAIKATSDTSGDVKGTLKDIDKDEVKIKKSGSSSTKTYEWAKSPKITYDGKTISSVSKMIDEYDDTSKTITVTLYLNSKDEITKMVAKKGSSSSKNDDDVIVGKLKDLTSKEVEVKNSDNNKTETYDLADNIKYKWEGKSADRRDIKDELDEDEDTIYVELTLDDDGDVKTLKASYDEDDFDSSSSSSSSKKRTGILLSVDKDEIRLDDDDKGKTYYDMPDDYEDDVEYRLDGKSSTYKKVRDAVKDYDEVTAKVYLNSDKEITKIDAETDDDSSSSSSSSSSKKGEIKKLTRGNITVGSSSNSYELISNVSVTIDGDNSYDINDLVAAFGDSRKFEAKLTVEHSIVTKIAAYTIEVEGELTSLNTSKEKIFIETKDGEEISFEYDEDDVKVRVDGDKEDIDYLKKRMDKYTYDATLTIEDGMVTDIDADR